MRNLYLHDSSSWALLVFAVQRHDKDEFKQALDEYSEFAKNIEQHLTDLERMDLAAEVKPLIKESQVEVRNYVRAGQEVLTLAESGRASEASAKTAVTMGLIMAV